jgi:AcrR family transcriptional regulator
MPRLWKDTIETHRRAVRDAAIDVTAQLVAKHGLRSVTMSEIAEGTGIGRATLYKYFPDVETILREWHEREIGGHLEELSRARDQSSAPLERLRAVLQAFATIAHQSRGHRDTELAALLHRDHEPSHAQAHVERLVADLIAECAATGIVRDDVSADELATFCVHALSAAGTLRSKAAVQRLVDVTLTALYPADRHVSLGPIAALP